MESIGDCLQVGIECELEISKRITSVLSKARQSRVISTVDGSLALEKPYAVVLFQGHYFMGEHSSHPRTQL